MLKTISNRAAVALLGAAVMSPALLAGPAEVRTGMLVSTAWLAEHLYDRNFVVLYIGRDRTQFDAGHVPGSRFVQLDELVEQRKDSLNDLPSVADLEALFGSLGVDNDSRVILMGGNGGMLAARAYFTLDYLGHGDNASLLDGGLEKWLAEARPVSRDETQPAGASFTVHVQPKILVSTEGMRRASLDVTGKKSSDMVLLDARPVNEYDGTVNSEGVPQAGHIAGAHSLYWKNLIRSESDPALLDVAELQHAFQRAGAKPGQRVITYCRTGMQSSFTYFVAKYLGHDAAMYDGSVYEWVNAAGHQLVLSSRVESAGDSPR